MNKKLNWDHIRFFIEVTRAGSVAKAASSLGVSHATALRNVSRLEGELGITLFDRLQSGYQITAQGEALLANALAMEEQAEKLVRRATGKNPAPEGLLRLSVPDRSLLDLIPLLAGFRREFPRITVQAIRGTAEAITESKADVAFVITNRPPDDLVGRQLGRIEFAYFASPTYLESKSGREKTSPDDFDWIIWRSEAADEESAGEGQEGALRRFSRQPNIVLQTANHEDARSAVHAGIGVSLLKQPQPGLEEMPFKSILNPVGIWVLTHQELRRSGRVRAFLDYTVDRFSERQKQRLPQAPDKQL